MENTAAGATSTLDAAKAEAATLAALVLSEQVRGVFSRGLLPYATNAVNAALLTALVWSSVNHELALGWLIAMLSMVAARLPLHFSYHRTSPPVEAARSWGRKAMLGALASGLLWGAASFVLYVPDNPVLQVLLVFVVGGMCAGATGSLATYQPAFRAFFLPALLPLFLRLVAENERTHFVMAAMIGLFGIAMASIAKRGEAALLESATLRFQNVAMSERLRAAQRDLEQLNEALDRRVKERTSELERTLESQRESEERLARFHALLNQAGAAIIVAEVHGLVVLEVNDVASELLARPRADLVGRRLDESSITRSLASRDDWRTIIDRARGVAHTFEDVLSRANGAPALPIDVATTVREIGGREYLLLSFRDLTSRKELEAQVTQGGLLASLGRLAAGVGHEINNPLAFVLANIDSALAALENEPRVAASTIADMLREARTGADRMRIVVKSLRAFSREERPARGAIVLNRVIETSVALAGNELRHRARTVVELGTPPLVLANEGQLTQVFVNLLLDAAQSIPEGDAEHNEVRVTSRVENDGSALVEVSNTGPGMSAEERARAFEPFFTTKSVSAGRGLGLSICHGIVTDLGGQIGVRSAEPRGATFWVRLPSAPKEATIVETTTPPSGLQRPLAPERVRVLVVDDEPFFVRALCRMLAPHYDVVSVDRARDAVTRVEAESFDVILCDLMMPDMTGMDLYDELARTHPKVIAQMIFMTGGAFTDRATEFLAAAQNATLTKPFTAAELLSAVATVVTRRRSDTTT